MKDKHENFIYSVLFHWKTFFTYISNSRHFPHISGTIFGNCQLLHVPHHTFDARFYQLFPMVRVNYMEKGTNTLRQITKFKFKITKVLCSLFLLLQNTYVKTVRNNSMTILSGALSFLRWPVSQSIFKIHSLPSLPCLFFSLKLKKRKNGGNGTKVFNTLSDYHSIAFGCLTIRYVLRNIFICLYNAWREFRCKCKSNFSNGVILSMLRFLKAGCTIRL